jgi:enoyl-CoA hydratase
MTDTVLTEAADGILVITLNRPEAKNAINNALAEGLAAALDRLDDDSELRAGILTGAGDTFCSGMDLKAFLKGESPVIPGRGLAGLTQAPPAKPLIAAVEGYALAGGMELALCCDLIIANEAAKFGIPEVKRGLVAGAGGLIRMPRQIPSRLAMQYALTGDSIDARRAYEIGLINEVTSGPALVAAKGMALRICKNGPLAVRISKEIVQRQANWSAEDMWDRQAELIEPIVTSHDAREGAAAFAEKRDPVWTGE